MQKRIVWACVGLTALWGCGSSGDSYQPTPVKPVQIFGVKPGEEATLFPFTEGNQWTYTGEIVRRAPNQQPLSRKFETTFKITKVVRSGSATKAYVTVTTDIVGAKTDYQIWEVNPRGIYQLSVGNPTVAFNPPQPAIVFPPEADKRFSWKGTGITPGSKVGTSVHESKILAPQEVDSEVGKHSAIPVETKGTFQYEKAKGQLEALAYWAPKVGLVRYAQTARVGDVVVAQALRLKASTVR